MSERRSFPRVEIELLLAGQIDHDRIELQVENISLGGVYVAVHKPWPIGTSLRLSLIRDGNEYSSEARVVHQAARGVGMAFVDPGIEFRHIVGRLIDEQLTEGERFISRRRSIRIPGRIAFICRNAKGYGAWITENVSEHGVLLTAGEDPFPEVQTITLSEHGLFDCDISIPRRTEDTVAIEFQKAAPEFHQAMDRIIESLLGLRR